MENKKHNPYFPIYFSLVLIAGIILGIWLGNRGGSFFTFQKKTDKLNEVLNYVEDNYVDTLGRGTLEGKAISGLLQGLDPHSAYISAEEFHEANDPLLGSFEGIGVQFRIENDTVAVILPISEVLQKKSGSGLETGS